MGLILPLGLLGLLSIIALIIIYIIKPKYQEKMVSSTVVWRLSLKYQKRKVPFQLLKRSLLFLIQLLILACFALMLARPFLNLDTYSGEKVFILDASASMLTKENGETRFDRALDDILKNVNQKEEEDKITVILADAQASFVARRDDSSENLKKLLSPLTCTFGGANITRAITLANGVLDENPEAEVVLYTDCDYEEAGYVKVKNMGSDEWNAALMGFDAKLEKGYYVFTADVGNYNKAANLTFELTVTYERIVTDKNGNSTTETVTETKNKTVSFQTAERQQITFGTDDGVMYTTFRTASVRLFTEDGFQYDELLYLNGDQAPKRNVELVSPSSWLLSTALRSNPDNYVYAAPIQPEPIVYHYGYDLYVYEEITPQEGGQPTLSDKGIPDTKNLPDDGAIVLINPNAAVARSFGITLAAGRQTGDYALRGTNDISSAYQTLTRLVNPSSIRVTQYLRATSYSGYEVILTCNGDPVLLAGERDGITVVVMLFDIHYSTLPNQYALPVLMRNICEYTAPNTLEKTVFDAGETVTINVKPNAQSVEIKFESLTEAPAVYTTYEEFPVSLKAEQAGKYTVTQNLANGKVKTSEFHVKPPHAESDFSYVGGYLAPESYHGSTGSASIQYNIMEFLPYIVGFCLLLLAVEWGLQYREQF